jgi:hypothetical protein
MLFSSNKLGNERDPCYDCSPKCLQLNFDYMHAQTALVVSCATRMRVCFGSMRSRGTVRCYWCVLCVVTVSSAGAEGNTERSWKVLDGGTELFLHMHRSVFAERSVECYYVT